MTRISYARLCFSGVSLLFVSYASFATSILPASIISLVSRGADYEGKVVIVEGYVCKNKDSKGGLFLTLDDCHNSNYSNAVAVDGLSHHSDALVSVRGVYRDRSNVVLTDDPYQWGMIETAYELWRRDVKRCE